MKTKQEKSKLLTVLGRMKRFFFSPLDGKGEAVSAFRKLRIVFSPKGLFLTYHYLFKILRLSLLSFKENLEYKFLNKQGLEKEHFRYVRWLKRRALTGSDRQTIGEQLEELKYQPFISVLILDKGNEKFIKQSLKSIQSQVYKKIEVLAAVSETCEEINYLKRKGVKVNTFKDALGGEVFSNLLKRAKGDYFIALNQGDTLSENALSELVLGLQETRYDMVYSDHDVIDQNGYHSSPCFKPDWSPDSFLSRNYIGNSNLINKKLATRKLPNVLGFDSSYLYQLLLCLTDDFNVKIHRVAKVLFHERKKNVVALDAHEEDVMAIEQAIHRRGEPGQVIRSTSALGTYSVRYQLKHKAKVTIIIPSKDQAKVLSNCLESIFQFDSYGNFEVFVVDNNSTDPAFFDLLRHWEQREPQRFKAIEFKEQFNFSRINNFAAKQATGDHLLFLNNDTEVLTEDWLHGMVEQAQRKSIGAVGVKLLFPNDTIQHAGVILGLQGASGHTFLYEPKDSKGYNNYIQSITNYSALTAACLMLRKDVFDEVGGFNEVYAVEFNDIDLCLRVRDLGYHNIYLPHVVLYHFESLSRGNAFSNQKNFDRYISEKSLFKKQWEMYIKDDPCYNPNLSKEKTDFRLGLN